MTIDNKIRVEQFKTVNPYKSDYDKIDQELDKIKNQLEATKGIPRYQRESDKWFLWSLALFAMFFVGYEVLPETIPVVEVVSAILYLCSFGAFTTLGMGFICIYFDFDDID